MKLSLVVSQGNPVGKEIPVRQAQFLIGRDPDCQLRPASPLVSKRHCALIVRGEQVFIRDFGSTNGTIVNGSPLRGEVEAKDGDELKFGPLCFRLKLVPEPATVGSGDTISDRAEASLSDTGTMRVGGTQQKAAPAAAAAPEPGLSDTRPLPAAKNRNAEDDIADLLFGIEGDSSANIAIPQGTTVMQSLQPEEEAAVAAAAAPAEPEKGKSNRAKIQDHKATSDAAKAILDKYMKRPRG